MNTTMPGASAPNCSDCSTSRPAPRTPPFPPMPRLDADGDLIPDVVPDPPAVMEGAELHTKTALAVAIMSASDRTAVAALGWMVQATAAARPLAAQATNLLHSLGRKVLADPERFTELLNALGIEGLEFHNDAGPRAVCNRCAPQRTTAPCDRGARPLTPEEVASLRDAIGGRRQFFATPEAYTAWLTVPVTVAPGDLSVVVQSAVPGIVAATLTRPPREGEEFLARGITVGFPIDARTADLTAVLEGNILTVKVPRRSNLAIPVTGPRSPEATAETIPRPRRSSAVSPLDPFGECGHPGCRRPALHPGEHGGPTSGDLQPLEHLHRLARVAFDAYKQSADGKTWDGRPIPAWDALVTANSPVVGHWIAAARAVEHAIAAPAGE